MLIPYSAYLMQVLSGPRSLGTSGVKVFQCLGPAWFVGCAFCYSVGLMTFVPGSPHWYLVLRNGACLVTA